MEEVAGQQQHSGECDRILTEKIKSRSGMAWHGIIHAGRRAAPAAAAADHPRNKEETRVGFSQWKFLARPTAHFSRGKNTYII